MNTIEALLHANEDYRGARHVVDVEGMSTPRVCNLLNDLVGSMGPDETYLEVGTWRGLTLCSAIANNPGKRCVACDKFRFWGYWTGFGWRARRALYENIARHRPGGAEVSFYEMRSELMFRRGLVPDGVKVYFYDGDHSYGGTYRNILSAAPLLCAESYLIVDDWNQERVRRATRDAIEDAGLAIAWWRALEGVNGDQRGWWNGIGAFWLHKPGASLSTAPETRSPISLGLGVSDGPGAPARPSTA